MASDMNQTPHLRHWSLKFRNAFRGIGIGVHGQTSFYAHFAITTLVFAAATYLQVSLIEWCVLLLCIGLVLSAELMNSCIERLAKVITSDYNEDVRDGLDIASGAVLMAAIFAAMVGTIILVFRFGLHAGWWGGYLLV